MYRKYVAYVSPSGANPVPLASHVGVLVGKTAEFYICIDRRALVVKTVYKR